MWVSGGGRRDAEGEGAVLLGLVSQPSVVSGEKMMMRRGVVGDMIGLGLEIWGVGAKERRIERGRARGDKRGRGRPSLGLRFVTFHDFSTASQCGHHPA